jgi:hypothetical protein
MWHRMTTVEENMSEKTELRTFGMNFDYADVVPQHYGNALVMMSEACHGYVEGAAQFNHELADFLRDRFDKNRRFGHALSSAEHLEDAASLHHDWLRAATDDYVTQTTRFFEICMGAATNGHANGRGVMPAKPDDTAGAKKAGAKQTAAG